MSRKCDTEVLCTKAYMKKENLQCSVNTNWQQEAYTELYTQDEMREILWWKTRIQKLRGIRGNTLQGIYHVHSKEEGWSYTLDNRLTNNADTGY